jgi:hypothetical protein
MLKTEERTMPALNVQTQDDLIRALMAHPDNFDRSPQFALGYMVSMMTRMLHYVPEDKKKIFLADIDFIIDRHKRS